LPGQHRKVYSNRSEADFVMPSGIITTYLVSRLVVRRGFPNQTKPKPMIFWRTTRVRKSCVSAQEMAEQDY
jgi:hypothetical protein